MFFIHIPKNAGTTVCRVIGQIWHHKPWLPIHKKAFTVIRNPIDFYISLYNFFTIKFDTISNQMKFITTNHLDLK